MFNREKHSICISLSSRNLAGEPEFFVIIKTAEDYLSVLYFKFQYILQMFNIISYASCLQRLWKLRIIKAQ